MKIFLIIFLAIPCILNSQEIIWEKHLCAKDECRLTGFHAIDSKDDGFYILCDKPGGAEKTILKLDNNGNKIWDLSFGKFDEDAILGGFLYLPDDWTVLYVGYRADDFTYPDAGYFYLLKCTDWGKYLWNYFGWGDGGRVLGSPHQMKLSNHKGYLVTGSYQRQPINNCYLKKTDEFGREIWNQYYDDTIPYDRMQPGAAIETQDGNYLFNYNLSKQGFKTRYGLIKTDTSGNLIWQQRYEFLDGRSTIASIKLCQDGGIVQLFKKRIDNSDSTFFNLVKYDSIGNFLWEKDFYYSHYNLPNHVNVTDDGGCLISGSTLIKDTIAGTEHYDFYLIKTDKNGDLVWDKVFGTAGKDRLTYAFQSKDGHYLVTGSSNDSAYVAKIKNPFVSTEQPSFIINLELSEPYPNPADSYCFINYSIPDNGLVQIRTTNSIGNILDIPVNKYMSFGNYQCMLDVNNYTTGLYFINLSYGSFSRTVPLMVVR